MAKNILEIDADEFERIAHRVSTSQLKGLISTLYALKWDVGSRWGIEQIKDVERKETRCMKILMERGQLTKKDYNDFYDWRKTLNKGKKVW